MCALFVVFEEACNKQQLAEFIRHLDCLSLWRASRLLYSTCTCEGGLADGSNTGTVIWTPERSLRVRALV